MTTPLLRSLPSAFLRCCLFATAASIAAAQPRMPPHRQGYAPSFSLLRDTLFLMDTMYLEIRLDRQMIYHHFKSGRVDAYTCSTGNPAIPDGIATRPGIFTVQSKARQTLSEQFQVYLNYWMGFDGGIGMHGLQSRSYYKFLGRRVSSHGCVRISNETGAQLFKRVPLGTVVYVHSGAPARVLAFADDSTDNLAPIYEIDRGVLKRRLDAVRVGRWNDSSLAQRLVIPARKRLRERVDVGVVNPRLVAQYPIAVSRIDVDLSHPPLNAVAKRPLKVAPLALLED